jgi:hypothetical protein
VCPYVVLVEQIGDRSRGRGRLATRRSERGRDAGGHGDQYDSPVGIIAQPIPAKKFVHVRHTHVQRKPARSAGQASLAKCRGKVASGGDPRVGNQPVQHTRMDPQATYPPSRGKQSHPRRRIFDRVRQRRQHPQDTVAEPSVGDDPGRLPVIISPWDVAGRFGEQSDRGPHGSGLRGTSPRNVAYAPAYRGLGHKPPCGGAVRDELAILDQLTDSLHADPECVSGFAHAENLLIHWGRPRRRSLSISQGLHDTADIVT